MSHNAECAACGEFVESYEVDLGGITEVRCIRCGLPLEKRYQEGRTRFRRVLVADDSAFFTQGLEDYLRTRGLAGDILLAADGAEAVEFATVALRERKPPNLVILDLLMPKLNGLHAAVALRAVERAFGARNADVLFLSSRQIDATLQPLLEDLAPAYYLNKGTVSGELMGTRLEEVLRAIASTSTGIRAG